MAEKLLDMLFPTLFAAMATVVLIAAIRDSRRAMGELKAIRDQFAEPTDETP